MSEIFEALMLLAFGASWPAQIIKTIRVKNPVGKSFVFLYLVQAGYLAGIAAKLSAGKITWVIWLYFLDFIMVATDTALSHYYLRRRRKTED